MGQKGDFYPKLYPTKKDLPEKFGCSLEYRKKASLRKRGGIYYAQNNVGGRQKRVKKHASNLQIAKEKARQIESAQMTLSSS